MQNNLSDTLNLLMAKARINSSELARATGLPATTIKRMRNQEQCNPTISTLTPIAAHFGITLNALLGGPSAPHSSHDNTIPLLDWTKAAIPDKPSLDELQISTEKPLSPGSYAIRMDHTLGPFPKDAILIIDRERQPDSLDYIIVSKKTSGTAAIKQYLIETDESYLQSLIPGISAIPHTKDYDVLGVIVQYRMDLK